MLHFGQIVLASLLILIFAACDASPVEPAFDEGEVVNIAMSRSPSGNANGQSSLVEYVDPASVELEINEVVQLTGLDASGQPVDVSWSSGDGSIANVNKTGLVTAVGAGSVLITAKSRNRTATASIVVAAPTSGAGTGEIEDSPPAPAAESCYDLPHQRLVEVSNASQLGSAISNAAAGDLIVLASGTYLGRWTGRASGTSQNPITMCGPREAVLADTRYDGGAVFRLSWASHWVLDGFTVRTSLWGIQLENSNRNVLRNLAIHDIGQEAVAIKKNSSHNLVQGVRIYDTGKRSLDHRQWGEGIYVGSWSGHWENSQPDRSDHNQIVDSHFGPNITAEHIDVKEGTTGTIIRNNVFDGRGMENPGDRVDSWVLVQGNDGLIENNRGSVSKTNGFRVWPGDGNWGQRNIFRRNTADVQADGYGFIIQGRDNVVSCDNVVTNAGSGFANVSCTN
jgi:hypothetical protein